MPEDACAPSVELDHGDGFDVGPETAGCVHVW